MRALVDACVERCDALRRVRASTKRGASASATRTRTTVETVETLEVIFENSMTIRVRTVTRCVVGGARWEVGDARGSGDDGMIRERGERGARMNED